MDQPAMLAIMTQFFLVFMMVGLVSPLAAIAAAVLLFVRHRRRVEPNRRVPVIGYILAIAVFGAIGGFLGMLLGLQQACPAAGNLCGLWPAFVTGPLSCALAILFVGVAVSLVRPASKADNA